MILEPQREIPPAVEAELAAMEERTLRRHANATGVASLLEVVVGQPVVTSRRGPIVDPCRRPRAASIAPCAPA
jgi:hypothetical protein